MNTPLFYFSAGLFKSAWDAFAVNYQEKHYECVKYLWKTWLPHKEMFGAA